MIRYWFCTILLFFLLMNQKMAAQNWPQWRGLKRDGQVAATQIVATWPEKLQQVWQTEVGEGHASPLVVQNKILIFSRQNNREVISCLDADTGKKLWIKNYPAPYSLNFAAYSHGKGPKSTPAFSAGKIVTLGISGILSCYEMADGKLLWRKEFARQFKATSPLYGTAMSPLISDGVCVVHLGGHDDGALTAIEMPSGRTKWQWPKDGPGYASPILATFENTRQVVTFSQEHLVGIDFASGKLLWQVPFNTPWTQNCVTPVVFKNTLILSGLSQGIMRIKVKKKGKNWSTETLWKNSEIGMYMSSPVMFDNLLVGFSDKRKGVYFTLDPTNGKLLWQSQGRVGDNAALLRAGEFLLSLQTNGELVVAQRQRQKFVAVKKYPVAHLGTPGHIRQKNSH